MLIFSPTRLAKMSRKIIANPYVASALPLGDAEIQSIFEPWQAGRVSGEDPAERAV